MGDEEAPEQACGGPIDFAGGAFTLSVKKITRGGEELVDIEARGIDTVSDVKAKLESVFQSELRFAGTFENFPADLCLVDVGVNEGAEVELIVSCVPLGPPPEEATFELIPAPECGPVVCPEPVIELIKEATPDPLIPADAAIEIVPEPATCGPMILPEATIEPIVEPVAALTFELRVNKITRAGEEAVTMQVMCCESVSEVKARLESTFHSELRFAGSFDNFPSDQTLENVGVTEGTEVELMVSCEPLGPPPGEALEALEEKLAAAISVTDDDAGKESILETFHQWDTDGSGVISKEEFQSVLEEVGMQREIIIDLFERVDVNEDGMVNYEEFCGWLFQGQE